MQCIEKIRGGEITAMSPKLAVTAAYMQNLRNAFDGTIWTSGCSSWYLDDEGIPATFPGPPSEYRKELAQPLLSEYEVIGATAS